MTMSKSGKMRNIPVLAQLAVLVALIQLSTEVGPENTSSQSENVVAFQAEDAEAMFKNKTANFRDRLRWRSNAQPKVKPQTLWLKDAGDEVIFHVCLPRTIEAEVKEVRFSTDGWEKTSTVLVNNVEVGNFSTVDNSNGGLNWNNFNVTTKPFRTVGLKKGWNDFVVLLEHSEDPYGIEIDQITISFGEVFSKEELLNCTVAHQQTTKSTGI